MHNKNTVIITQQWDYYSKGDDFLINESLIKDCAEKGVTSFQSYVYWASIEKDDGVFDLSFYLKLVEILKKYHLKWTPFIILGPYYSVPKWFYNSEKSITYKCLEHDKNSKIQSLWNPYLIEKVDILLKKISETFYHEDIESVLLGISGNWGESLYPVDGGFLRKEKDFHTHFGVWAGDSYAKESFKNYVHELYRDIASLNQSWGCEYSDFSQVDCSFIKTIPTVSFPLRAYRYIARNIQRNLPFIKFPFLTKQIGKTKKNKELMQQKRERDFYDWYIHSMTAYSEAWLKLARKYFPDNEIYLVTGGNGCRKMGADFTEQMKVASRYGAGIRITNQNDDYSESFVLTLWVASAAKHYKTDFITEEAWYNSPAGVAMRIFDAETSHARGIYYKTLIDCKLTPSWELIPFAKGNGGEVLKENLKFYKGELPINKTAILLSNTTNRMCDNYILNLYHSVRFLRRYIPFDFICENMIDENALSRYEYLVITNSCILKDTVIDKIKSWKKNGGKIIITNKSKIISEMNIPVKLEAIIMGKNWKKIGKKIAKNLYRDIISGNLFSGKVYYSLFNSKILLFNTKKKCKLNVTYYDKKHKISISKYEIIEIRR